MRTSGEILSPNQTKQKKRPPTAPRIQSPTSPFFLGSNDDHFERVQARAAALLRARRPANVNAPPPPITPDNCLGREQIVELLQNCIKLASENKINHKNTWELKLIDHLSEVVKVETEDKSETNFQKVSFTLEAGVRIYAIRVDSVHAEAYKVLGRIIRACGEDDQGKKNVVGGGDLVNGPDDDCSKTEKAKERKISPLSTLAPSFEDLNVKKFDVAFTVDPLYSQTSALFDECGAKGLLLDKLGVYGGCKVVFDSFEMTRQCFSCSTQDRNCVIDLSFIRDYVERMKNNMTSDYEISPTLTDIVRQFDRDIQRPSHTFSISHEHLGMKDAISNCDVQLDSEVENCDVEDDINAESFSSGDTFSPGHHHEVNDLCTSYTADMDDTFGEVSAFLFQGLQFLKQQNAWAGPDHWKYQKPKDDVPQADSRSSDNKSLVDLGINFMKSLEKPMTCAFAPPKNPKLLLLPQSRVIFGSLLPEDCHYQPEDLVKLFLLPTIMCSGKSKRHASDNSSWQPNSSFDDDNSFVAQHDDGYFASKLCGSGGLVSPSRQVNKVAVQYDKTSKQVDVHMLKETLWDHIQKYIQKSEMVCKDGFSFKCVLATFPMDCLAAQPEDISPHLCFICLLHLANEYNLSISGCSTLDDLRVYLPSYFGNA